MAYSALEDFVRKLELSGELLRITEPVATELEITEFADRQMKSPGGGKALIFERPTIKGVPSRFPVAINLMGSAKRMALALGVASIEDLAHQLQLILKAKPPASVGEGWALLKQGIDLLHARPRKVRTGPCQEVVHLMNREPSLTLDDLPILQCWPKDGGTIYHSADAFTPWTPTPASGTSACIGCRFSMARLRACIGRFIKSARGMARVITKKPAACRWRSV